MTGALAVSRFPPGFVPISNCTVQSKSDLNCSQITDASCDHFMDLGVVCRTYEELLEECSGTDSPPTPDTPGDIATIIALGIVIGVLAALLLGVTIALAITCHKR